MSAAWQSWTGKLLAPVVLGLLVACAGEPVRFSDGPVVVRIADEQDIPEPGEQDFWRYSHHVNNFVSRPARLGLDPLPPKPALDVNRFGEVPSSSWYENRTSTLSPRDVALGPGGGDPGPEAFKPWTIVGMKVGGRNPGLVMEDSRGVRYICKFDKPGEPVVATGAGAVAARLLWACGYRVPDDRVVMFQRDDLVIGGGATYTNHKGRKLPVTDEQVDEVLEGLAARDSAGRYRSLVSRFLPGKPVGGYAYRGTRADDPNDTIPHENRRSLRGMRVFGAWVNHVDVKIDNTLDLYTAADGRHFLRHYLVDFDGCLGGYWAARHEARIGFAYDFDWAEFATGMIEFGLYKRPYEGLVTAGHPEIGVFEADVYNPATWKANYVNDQLWSCNPADAFWAGTVLAQLSEAHVRAAVSAGRYEDPRAEQLLTQVLVRRWEKTVDWALSRVTPVVGLERVTVDDDGLTISPEDALEFFGRPSNLRFRAALLDVDGETLAHWDAGDSPEVSISNDLLTGHHYIVVEWTATGPDGDLPSTQAHYAYGDGGWHLVGILRDGE